MGLFLIGGHWPKILLQNSKGASKMCVLCMCTVYGVLFCPLWLKYVPGWPAISVSSLQDYSLGHMIWFGKMSDISQLALHYLAQGEGQGGGLASLPLVDINARSPNKGLQHAVSDRQCCGSGSESGSGSPDPHYFGPPGSGSGSNSQRYGSGFFLTFYL
jgi:hypothetical protein